MGHRWSGWKRQRGIQSEPLKDMDSEWPFTGERQRQTKEQGETGKEVGGIKRKEMRCSSSAQFQLDKMLSGPKLWHSQRLAFKNPVHLCLKPSIFFFLSLRTDCSTYLVLRINGISFKSPYLELTVAECVQLDWRAPDPPNCYLPDTFSSRAVSGGEEQGHSPW